MRATKAQIRLRMKAVSRPLFPFPELVDTVENKDE